jgi:hypothetical protein
MENNTTQLTSEKLMELLSKITNLEHDISILSPTEYIAFRAQVLQILKVQDEDISALEKTNENRTNEENDYRKGVTQKLQMNSEKLVELQTKVLIYSALITAVISIIFNYLINKA